MPQLNAKFGQGMNREKRERERPMAYERVKREKNAACRRPFKRRVRGNKREFEPNTPTLAVE